MKASMEQLNNLESLKNSNGRDGDWGIDKKIPVALIFVVVLQTLGFTWGAATLSNDVKNNGKAIAKLESQVEKITEKFDDKFKTLRSKEESRRELGEMKNQLENLEERVLDVERSIHK